MKSIHITFTLLAIAFVGHTTTRAQDPLPSWNDGPAKQAIVDFVRTTTGIGGARFVSPEERIATFDQDGTLWVEHPIYSQEMYCLERVPVLAREKPELKDGKPILTKEPKLLLNDNDTGKPEGIHLMIGRRPYAAFGNSTGDQQMLEYTKAGDGARLSMLVLHDDSEREYAYGPAQGLPDSKVGTFTQALYDEAKKDGWFVISMKNDWKVIFPFELGK
jgi:hypothetical protein